MKESKCNGFSDIIAQAISEMEAEQGKNFSLDHINLAELERRTGISRAKLRRLKENGFVSVPHGLTGQKESSIVTQGYSGFMDNLLRQGVANSSVCLERNKNNLFTSTIIEHNIYSHKFFRLQSMMG